MIQDHHEMAVRSCHNTRDVTDAVGDDISIFVVRGGPCDGREWNVVVNGIGHISDDMAASDNNHIMTLDHKAAYLNANLWDV